MAAAHGRVADFQLQNFAGRVFGVQRVPIAGVERGFFGNFCQMRLKGRHALGRQQADGLAQHQPHQVVVRVVAARDLARKAGRGGDDAVDFGLVLVAVFGLHLMHQAVFEQALVNPAQMRDGQVAVINPAVQQVFSAARERVDDGRHDGVGHFDALQQRGAGRVKQAAVVSGHANIVVAFVDELEYALQREPD